MSKLAWSEDGTRFYEAGIDRGVLYIDDNPGVAWNGLISVGETPVGGEAKPYYLDGVKILNTSSPEEFEGTIEAYTYPDEFMACDGSQLTPQNITVTQQPRKQFSLCYRTLIGNDVDGTGHAYRIHLVYNALATPTEKNYRSIGGEVDPTTFNWTFTTIAPRNSVGFYSTAHVILDSTRIDQGMMELLETYLYGNLNGDPRMLTLEDLVAIIDAGLGFRVTDNLDGTWTLIGNSNEVIMTSPTSFILSQDKVVSTGPDSYTISTD